MCDPTNHKSYGLGLIAVTEVRKGEVYMLGDLIFIFY